MCSHAAIWARIGRIVYGARRQDVSWVYFEGRRLNTPDFIADSFRDDLAITQAVLVEECAALYFKPGDPLPPDQVTNL